jgi:hypothetical protein
MCTFTFQWQITKEFRGRSQTRRTPLAKIFPLPRSSTVDRLGQAEAIRQVVLSWIAPTIGQELANGGLGSYTFI